MKGRYISKRIVPVILAGGLGTRLRTIVSHVPKVMAPVLGKPFIKILIDQVAAANFQEVILCTGHMSEKVRTLIGEKYRNINIIYSEERELLGTGGAVINAINIVPSEAESILVMNGDSYLDIGLTQYIKWFVEKKIDAALALKYVRNTERYGSVSIDSKKKVIEFKEKKPNSGSGWINAGIYIFKRNVLDSFEKACRLSLEKDILPKLKDMNFFGYECNGEFIDIGTPESYARSESFFKKISRPSK